MDALTATSLILVIVLISAIIILPLCAENDEYIKRISRCSWWMSGGLLVLMLVVGQLSMVESSNGYIGMFFIFSVVLGMYSSSLLGKDVELFRVRNLFGRGFVVRWPLNLIYPSKKRFPAGAGFLLVTLLPFIFLVVIFIGFPMFGLALLRFSATVDENSSLRNWGLHDISELENVIRILSLSTAIGFVFPFIIISIISFVAYGIKSRSAKVLFNEFLAAVKSFTSSGVALFALTVVSFILGIAMINAFPIDGVTIKISDSVAVGTNCAGLIWAFVFARRSLSILSEIFDEWFGVVAVAYVFVVSVLCVGVISVNPFELGLVLFSQPASDELKTEVSGGGVVEGTVVLFSVGITLIAILLEGRGAIDIEMIEAEK